MKIEIIRPYILLLLPILIGTLIISRKYLPIRNNSKKATTIAIRVILFSLLILSLSGLSINWANPNTSTIFLVDLSDSVKNYKSKAEAFIKDALTEMPSNNKVGIIAFGSDTRIEQFLTDKNIFSDFGTLPISTATNLEKAVQTALSLLTTDSAGRIVLITDGNENEGSLRNMSSSLTSSNIAVKVLKIENEEFEESYVSNVTVPDKVNIGDTFSVNVEVESNTVTSATLYLYSGKNLKAEENVTLQKGTNKFIFKDTQTSGGLKTYKVVVETNNDTQTVNNEYTAFTTAQTSPVILLIEGSQGESEEFAKLLDAVNVNYITILPTSAPQTISLLNEYKSIIMLDVHGDDLPKGFKDNLKSYVKDYAGGFIAIGGEDSFALGEYKNTPIEEVLPVYMDLKGEKEIPETAITLVIDHSGSMSDGDGYITNLDLAKEAAIKALATLRPIDTIGVLTFDDSYQWVVPLTKATNTDAIEEEIYDIALGGGTSIYPAVNEASKKLVDNKSKIKHIILLTDGQDGFREYDDLIKRLEDEEITLSAVSVGSGADTQMLQLLAKAGGGRYYHTDLGTNIPRIFAKEVFLSVKSYLINEEFTPVVTSNHSILSEVTNEGLPSLMGYIASSKKELATSLLISHSDDPILTVWQYGLGKSVAWNSDGDNRWTGNYAGWDKYALLWKNIINWVITDTDESENNISITQTGGTASIEYIANEYTEGTKVKAVYTTDSGASNEIELEATAPGKFTTNIKPEEIGIYSLNIRKEENGEVVSNQNTAFALQYSQEYRFTNDNNVLEDFTRETNGKFISESIEVFDDDIASVKSKLALTNLLLLLAIIIFMLDIAYRRLKVNVPWDKYVKRIQPAVGKVVARMEDIKAREKPSIERVDDTKVKKVKKVSKEKVNNKTRSKKDVKENQLLDTSELLKKKSNR